MHHLKSKPMIAMLIAVLLLFGGIFGFQAIKLYTFKRAMMKNSAPPVTVSAAKATYQTWMPTLKAASSLRAVRGVDVTTELAGLVTKIHFVPGAEVAEGQLLVELNADADIAHLNALKATADLELVINARDRAQYAIQAISKAILDADVANLKNAQAQVDEQAAIVAKKTIRAPFAGRLGVSLINPGQYINPGDKIVNLQELSPLYADFYLPQQALTEIAVGQVANLTTDTYPGRVFSGKITTINPQVDPATRNVQVEATIDNTSHALFPGMFAKAEVTAGEPHQYITLPQTAITFNPYGEIVYLITPSDPKNASSPLKVTQEFVKVGETRGDQIAILSGVKAGDSVVTSGQLKLKNGSIVVINNQVVPLDNPAPQITD